VTATASYPDLEGKVVVITGGSAGIGAAAARLFVDNGAKVVISARRPGPVEALVDELRERGGEAVGCPGDAADPEDMERLARTTEEAFGRADVIMPFAGGFRSYTPLPDITVDEWRRVVDDNLTSTFLTVRPFLKGMIERRQGVIITMASNSARMIDVPLTASYASSKGGVVVFTRHAARELGAHGIRVNCLAPATVLSERIEAVMPDDVRARVTELSPLGRIGSPLDAANATLFLASDVSGWMTGVTMDVAGGRVML
jgi:3-oxoacyl-[acyl-carrier protein] reductase